MSDKVSLTDPNIPIMVLKEGVDNPWLMQITHDKKVRFNREAFPDLAEDDFATKVMDILEKELY